MDFYLKQIKQFFLEVESSTLKSYQVYYTACFDNILWLFSNI